MVSFASHSRSTRKNFFFSSTDISNPPRVSDSNFFVIFLSSFFTNKASFRLSETDFHVARRKNSTFNSRRRAPPLFIHDMRRCERAMRLAEWFKILEKKKTIYTARMRRKRGWGVEKYIRFESRRKKAVWRVFVLLLAIEAITHPDTKTTRVMAFARVKFQSTGFLDIQMKFEIRIIRMWEISWFGSRKTQQQNRCTMSKFDRISDNVECKRAIEMFRNALGCCLLMTVYEKKGEEWVMKWFNVMRSSLQGINSVLCRNVKNKCARVEKKMTEKKESSEPAERRMINVIQLIIFHRAPSAAVHTKAATATICFAGPRGLMCV